MKHSVYHIKNERLSGLHFAIISDLHGCSPEPALEILGRIAPNYILAPGDIFEILDGRDDDKNENGYELLAGAAKIAPTFYSGGNHEIGGTRSWTLKWRFKNCEPLPCSEENKRRIEQTGAHILSDGYEIFDGIAFGGVSSGITYKGGAPRLDWIEKYYCQDRPKILLCHHPEYYKKYIDGSRIDLVASGHAHGGQWRIFGRGVFAPGQGIFPKFTSGVYDGKLCVSRGLKEGHIIPRIFNSTEVVSIIFD